MSEWKSVEVGMIILSMHCNMPNSGTKTWKNPIQEEHDEWDLPRAKREKAMQKAQHKPWTGKSLMLPVGNASNKW